MPKPIYSFKKEKVRLCTTYAEIHRETVDFQASREVGAHVSPALGAAELPDRPALGLALLAQAVEGPGVRQEGGEGAAAGALRGGLRGSINSDHKENSEDMKHKDEDDAGNDRIGRTRGMIIKISVGISKEV